MQGCALKREKNNGPAGIRTPTNGSEVRYAIHYVTGPLDNSKKERRATDGIRTRDTQNHNLVLYQLNYGRHNRFLNKRGGILAQPNWRRNPFNFLGVFFVLLFETKSYRPIHK